MAQILDGAADGGGNETVSENRVVYNLGVENFSSVVGDVLHVELQGDEFGILADNAGDAPLAVHVDDTDGLTGNTGLGGKVPLGDNIHNIGGGHKAAGGADIVRRVAVGQNLVALAVGESAGTAGEEVAYHVRGADGSAALKLGVDEGGLLVVVGALGKAGETFHVVGFQGFGQGRRRLVGETSQVYDHGGLNRPENVGGSRSLILVLRHNLNGIYFSAVNGDGFRQLNGGAVPVNGGFVGGVPGVSHVVN